MQSRRRGATRSFASPVSDGARHFAVGLATLDRLALVVGLLPLGEPQRDLRFSLEEVELQRHDGPAFALEGPDEPLDLASVEEELPGPHGLMVPAVSLFVGCDVHPLEPELPLLDLGPGLLDGRLPGPKRLDLRSPQHQTRLDRLEDEVVVGRLRVTGYGHP